MKPIDRPVDRKSGSDYLSWFSGFCFFIGFRSELVSSIGFSFGYIRRIFVPYIESIIESIVRDSRASLFRFLGPSV